MSENEFESVQVPSGKTSFWVTASVLAAFIQAAFTAGYAIWSAGIEAYVKNFDHVSGPLGLWLEAIVFMGLGLAVRASRLWAAYALAIMTLWELTTKLLLGVPPLFSIIFLAVCVRGAITLKSEGRSPSLKILPWKLIFRFAILALAANFTVAFVYGLLGLYSQKAAYPSYWFSTLLLGSIVFAFAARSNIEWKFEIAIATACVTFAMGSFIDIPFNIFVKNQSVQQAFSAYAVSILFQSAQAILGWGLSVMLPLEREKTRGQSKNYFVRHWRGELALWKSFWINLIAVNCAIWLSTEWLSDYFAEENEPQFLQILLIIFAFGYVTFVWQMVGLWRCAHAYAVGAMSSLLARISQGVAVLILVFQLAYLPAFFNTFELVTGLDEYSGFKVSVETSGRMVIVTGYISYGLAEAVRNKLREYPDIETVELNSDGGNISESHKLYSLIKEKNLSTFTRTGCHSACTISFLAGKQRILNEGATLGFHRAHIRFIEYPQLKYQNKVDQQYFINAGIKKDFIVKAFSTPAGEIWFPSPDELIDSGIVTDISK